MRTSEEAVEKIIEVDENIDLTPFMEAANELVTEFCTDSDYADSRLEKIETWLAAHLYAIRDMRLASESVGGVSVSYQYRIGLYLEATMYGQQALILDTAGNLASLSQQMVSGGKKVTPSISWIGTDEDDEVEE